MLFKHLTTYLQENAPLTLELEAQLAAARPEELQGLLRAFNKDRRPDQQATAVLFYPSRCLIILEEDRLFLDHEVDQDNVGFRLLFWRNSYQARHGALPAAQVLLEVEGREEELAVLETKLLDGMEPECR